MDSDQKVGEAIGAVGILVSVLGHFNPPILACAPVGKVFGILIMSTLISLHFLAICIALVHPNPDEGPSESTALASKSGTSKVDPIRDWPGWRGPTSDGVSSSHRAPTEWGAGKNIRWSADLPGRGNGSPTVVGQNVFVPTCDEKAGSQSIFCFDRTSGKEKWQTLIHPDGAVRKNERSTGASTTIACDGERLYATFANSDAVFLSCLSIHGEIVWQKRFSDYLVHQGYGASPFLYRELVLVVADHRGGGTISAVRASDGEVVWKRERPPTPNYPSPIVHHLFGRDQLIMIGCDQVISYHPETGETLWETSGSTTECVTTTVTDGKHVYSSGGYPNNHLSAILADGSKKIAWQNGDRLYVPSLIHRQGFLYGTLDAGIAKCWNSQTGEEMWKGRLGGNFSASPVLVGDHIYAVNESGQCFLFEAKPDAFKLVASNQLGDECFASPAICDGQIFLRVAHIDGSNRQEKIYCITSAD